MSEVQVALTPELVDAARASSGRR